MFYVWVDKYTSRIINSKRNFIKEKQNFLLKPIAFLYI